VENLGDTLDVAAFKHVVVPIGVVIGLGVARMITVLSQYLQHRDRVRIPAGPLLWSATLFLWFVGLWWIAWGLRSVETDLWSFFTLIFLLLGPSLMYLASTLLLPDLPAEGYLDLGARLGANARPFFAALVGVLLWLLLSEVWLRGEPWLVLPKRIFQGIAITLFAAGALWPSERASTWIGAIALPLVIIALAMVRGTLGA